MENGTNIRYHSCGCDYLKGKGKNIRFFWYVVAGIIGVMLILFMMGSCLGCEACFDCAAACDDECGTDLESCGRECDAATDDCVQCDGVDCGDRVGCFSCNGKWDCSTCSGEVIYTITIYDDNGNVLNSYEISSESLEDLSRIQPMYPTDGRNSTYYVFEGYFNKNGRPYTDEQGNLERELKGSTDLYAKYSEKGEGEEYTLMFNTTNTSGVGPSFWFETPQAMPVWVGDIVMGVPQAPYIDGYTFLGWYNDNGDRVLGPEEDEFYFHLYLFNQNPDNGYKAVQLTAKYAMNEYEVTFVYRDGNRTSTSVTYGVSLNSIWSQYDRSNNNLNYKFFGWATYQEYPPYVEPTLGSLVDGSTIIENDMTLYEVRRDWVTLNFHLNINPYGGDMLSFTYYEGQQCIFSDLVGGGGENLNEFMSQVGTKPGYKFNGWRVNGVGGLPADSITVQTNGYHDFYASWSEVSYRIEYYDEWGVLPAPSNVATTYKYGQGVALWNYGADVYDDSFLGWRIIGGDSTIYMQIPPDKYGDIKLIAVFSN